MYGQDFHGFLSQPVPVHWAGWESDTHRLQQMGWQLSAEQDIGRDSLRLAMRHEHLQLKAISENVALVYIEAAHDPRYIRNLRVNVPYMASNFRVEMIDDLSSFRAIDAEPMYTQREVKDLDDFGIFAVPAVRTQELIVDPDSISDMMSRILELQDPARQAHYKSLARENRGVAIKPQQKFHAQIIEFAA